MSLYSGTFGFGKFMPLIGDMPLIRSKFEKIQTKSCENID